MSDVHERLRRLLLVVPYVSRNPGITVDALAKALGLSREELLRDLDLLTLVGRPPFQPDDFIDLHVENDRVTVELDQRFTKPPRLTPAEAAALAAAGELLRPAAGGALGTALSKLEKVLPAAARLRYHALERTVDMRTTGSADLGEITRAIAERWELTFDYAGNVRTAVEARRVEPLELFSHRGQWYLSAWDAGRADQRLFRVDRMAHVVVTHRKFSPRVAAPSHVPDPAQRAEVRVRFSAVAAPYLRERFGSEVRELSNGGVEVRVVGDSERWLTQWVLSFGGEAEVVEPAWARAAVGRAAEHALKG
jgi:proteasome accessory factor C